MTIKKGDIFICTNTHYSTSDRTQIEFECGKQYKIKSVEQRPNNIYNRYVFYSELPYGSILSNGMTSIDFAFFEEQLSKNFISINEYNRKNRKTKLEKLNETNRS